MAVSQPQKNTGPAGGSIGGLVPAVSAVNARVNPVLPALQV